MKEIRYICGSDRRDNQPVNSDVFEAFELGLCKAFGGFTCTFGRGGFIMADGTFKSELCRIYDVAIPRSTIPGMARSFALHLKTTADQECVYFRDTDGSVELVGAVHFHPATDDDFPEPIYQEK